MVKAADINWGKSRHEAIMFASALLLLLLHGLVLPHLGVSLTISRELLMQPALYIPILALWAFIVLESALGMRYAQARWRSVVLRFLIIAIVPPSRMALATHAPPGWIWLPVRGWQLRGNELFERLERWLAIPMLLITLLIVPVVIIELFFQAEIAAYAELELYLHWATTLVWFAFAAEFILLISVTPNKLTYCKQHWINIIIIILPLVAFLRTLVVVQMLKVNQAVKLLRAYRLRGLLMRTQRIALLLNLIDRVRQLNPERYLQVLREREQYALRKLTKLRAQIRATEARVAKKQARRSR